jgi:predicted peptidase
MPDSRAVALALSTALACACATAPRAPSSSPHRQTAHEAAGQRSLLHLPAAYGSRSDWPVILFLHGAGERGSDLALVAREGLPRILETLPDFPFVVVSPQEERNRRWTPDALAALVDDVAARFRVDASRVYVTGLSTGATAALDLAIRHPEKVAAVAAVTATSIPRGLCGMKDVPVWIFNNGGDERVPASRARKLARDLERCGRHGEVKVTIYPREGHDAWTETYRHKDLYDWMLHHRKRVPAPRARGEGRGEGPRIATCCSRSYSPPRPSSDTPRPAGPSCAGCRAGR